MFDLTRTTAVDEAVAVTTTLEAEPPGATERIWDDFADLYRKRLVERGTRIAPYPFASVIEDAAQDWLWLPKGFRETALVIGGEQYEAIFDAGEIARRAQRIGKSLFIVAAAMCVMLTAGAHLVAGFMMFVVAVLALSQWWRVEGYLLEHYCARICAACPSLAMPPYYAAVLRSAETEALAERKRERKNASKARWSGYWSSLVRHD